MLDHVDADARAFLLRCSVLRSMNDALIVRLTGEDNGQQRLEELERQGLFIHRMDDTGEWFNFHPLFASFLRQRCQWELALELPGLHRAAAEGWLALGYPAEAIHHALAASDVSMLRDILLQHARSLFHHSELALLEECLNALPYERLIQNPKLALLQAAGAEPAPLRRGQHPAGARRAHHARTENRDRPNAARRVRRLARPVAINAGKPEEAERLATEALKFLPLSSYYSRIVATSVTGEVHHCKGELARALPMMQQTEQMARRHQANHYALWALLQQSEILIAQGFLQAAYETGNRRAHGTACTNFCCDPPDGSTEALAAAVHRLAKDGQCCSAAPRTAPITIRLAATSHGCGRCPLRTEKPGMADNHFTQGQWRNIARVQILLGQYDEAGVVLDELNENARRLRLVSDLNRNLLLSNQLYWLQERKGEAQQALIEALSLANRTGFISHIVIEGEAMAQQLRQLIQLNTLPELEQHRAQRILRDINQHHRHKFAHFDENFVDKLLTHPQVPELIRTSPLTQREWQVLGLIYSGYSNDQIAGELDVAATTIKTHIRNLYQKLGVAHRREAVQQAQQLLKMMGYGA